MKLLSIASLFLLSINFLSCKKENTPPLNQLPPETHTGANTFGCLIDGKAFVVRELHPNPNNQIEFYLQRVGDGWTVNSFRTPQRVTLYFKNRNTPIGTYYLGGQEPLGTGLYQNDYSVDYYSTDSTHSGIATITYSDSSIFAGTFEFDAKKTNSDSIVHVTNGRFDIHL